MDKINNERIPRTNWSFYTIYARNIIQFFLESAENFIDAVNRFGEDDNRLTIQINAGRFYLQEEKLLYRRETANLINNALVYFEKRDLHGLSLSTAIQPKALNQVLQEARTALQEQENAPQSRPPNWVRITWAGVILAILAVLGMTVYHIAGPSREETTAMAPPPLPRTAAAPQVETENSTGFPETLLAANGRTLQWVEEPGSEQGFYADPKLITYHHYVEFLNEVADRVEVAEGIVKSGDAIWIYIGEGDGGTNPILYIDGRFQLRSAERAPDPVVRVTWKGAQAYAAYYELQLPTYDQWQILRREPGFAPQNGTPTENSIPQTVHERMMGASGAMGGNAGSGTSSAVGVLSPVHKEWVTTSGETTRDGVADWQPAMPPPSPVHRYAWEAFDDVGFRTVLNHS